MTYDAASALFAGRRIQLPVFVVLAGVLGACAGGGADGFDDGTTSEAPDTALIRGLMEGMGAVDPKSDPIDYKPRAPLAMPTKMTDLPPPEEKHVAKNWPKTDNSELDELRAIYAETPLNGKRLTPEQMAGVPALAAATRPRDVEAERQENYEVEGGRLTLDQMKNSKAKIGKVDTSELYTPDGQVKRRYLVEPPVEYSTPAPNAPLVASTRDESEERERQRQIQKEIEGGRIKMD